MKRSRRSTNSPTTSTALSSAVPAIRARIGAAAPWRASSARRRGWTHPGAVVMIATDDEDEALRHIQVVAGNRTATRGGVMFRIEGVTVDGLTEEITRAVEIGSVREGSRRAARSPRVERRVEEPARARARARHARGEPDARDARATRSTPPSPATSASPRRPSRTSAANSGKRGSSARSRNSLTRASRRCGWCHGRERRGHDHDPPKPTSRKSGSSVRARTRANTIRNGNITI